MVRKLSMQSKRHLLTYQNLNMNKNSVKIVYFNISFPPIRTAKQISLNNELCASRYHFSKGRGAYMEDQTAHALTVKGKFH